MGEDRIHPTSASDTDEDTDPQVPPLRRHGPMVRATDVGDVVAGSISTLGDAFSLAIDVSCAPDPFIYCVYVHLSPDSHPQGLTKGVVTLLQLPRVSMDRPDQWMAMEIYECPRDGCDGILADDIRGGLYWMCPKCGDLATVDPDLVCDLEKQNPGRVVRRAPQRVFSFQGMTKWGDVLAEYVERLWNMRKTSDGHPYEVMLLVRRPRAFLQKLTRAFLESPSAKKEQAMWGHHIGEHSAAAEYSLYCPKRLMDDIEVGSSLARRLAVFLGG